MKAISWEELRTRIEELLREAQAANQQPNTYRLMPWAVQKLEDLRDEFAGGQPSAERRLNIAYGIYRTVIEDDISHSDVGKKLLDLSGILAEERGYETLIL